jgi:hypothetical protein
LCKILAPVHRATLHLEGSYVTLPLVPIVISKLLKSLYYEPTRASIHNDLAEILYNLLQHRFRNLFTTVNLALMAAVLHPRYCKFVKDTISPELYKEVWHVIRTEMTAHFPDEPPVQSASTGLQKKTLRDRSSQESAERDLKLLRRDLESGDSGSEGILEYYKRQSNEGRLHMSVQKIVKSILSIPASTAIVERLFSSLGFVSTNRPSLLAQNLRNIALVRAYGKDPNFSADELYKLVMSQPQPEDCQDSDSDEPGFEEPFSIEVEDEEEAEEE